MKFKWHRTKKRVPKKPGNYLGCWRTPLIPREGTSMLHIGVFFFRDDGKWFYECEEEVPEYWCKYCYPDYTKHKDR